MLATAVRGTQYRVAPLLPVHMTLLHSAIQALVLNFTIEDCDSYAWAGGVGDPILVSQMDCGSRALQSFPLS